MSTTFIYCLKDPDSLEVRYVGKANNPKSRYSRHLADAKIKPKCHRLCWIKGLIDNNKSPILHILEECDELIWGEREDYWISQFDNLTNMIDGGKFCPSLNPEIAKRIKKTKQENPQKFSKETRAKLAIHAKSLWEKGIFKAQKKSDESKLKMTNSMKIRWQQMTKEKRLIIASNVSAGKCKPVIQMDMEGNFIAEFPSAKMAEETLKIGKDQVSACCRVKGRISAKGFKWMLKSKYEATKNKTHS